MAMLQPSPTPRPAPFFVGEHPALDFLNSIAAPWGTLIEWIEGGADLVAWLEQAGLMSSTVARQMLRQSRKELDVVAEEARDLREWFRAFVRTHAGRPLEARVVGRLQRLNRLLERDECYRQLEAGPRWHRERRWRTPEALLLPLADAMGDLVCDADFELVRKCEGPGCLIWFLDTSKGHQRRWCSMAVCGNRVKAAAHRRRADRRNN
jgi:predicted RNA-binding Zn ribbon-like protein